MLKKLCSNMKTPPYLFFLVLLINQASCLNMKEIFDSINKDFVKFNIISATIEWETAVNPRNPELPAKATENLRNRLEWQRSTCRALSDLREKHGFTKIQQRQTYLLCRGPKYTDEEARTVSGILQRLQNNYFEAKICLPVNKYPTNNQQVESAILNYINAVKRVLKNDSIVLAAKAAAFIDKDDDISEEDVVFCLRSEADFNRVMRYSRRENVLRWVWLLWREIVTQPVKKPFDIMLDIQQRAAKRNGYEDIGVSLRDELEVPNLRELCRHLYFSIRPFYMLLHGVTRFYLRKFYGDVVPEKGPIPAHLLGDLWSQNWDSIIDLIVTDNLDLDESIKKLNWTVKHMVKNADDFYQSLGLPPMTKLFWRYSVFTESMNHETRCHGSAADMFRDGDYRILYCSGRTFTDMYVLHHEMGHIQYYMACAHLQGLFRQANTALHETIGDTIMLAVMTPQHLNRIGLINDSILFNTETSIKDNEFVDDDNLDDLTQEILYPYVVDRTKSKRSESKILKVKIDKSKDKDQNQRASIYYNDDDDDRSKYRYSETTTYKTINNNIKDKMFSELMRNRIRNKNEHDVQSSKQKMRISRNYTREEIPKLRLTSEELLMLKLALTKIPQIPFALVIDEFRWDYYEGSIDVKHPNKEFWEMALEFQGIAPPNERTEEYFDVAAIFHVPDNTPYIRYFLSNFLQHQLFEKICKAVVYGRRQLKDKKQIPMRMNRCDIYGSHTAGNILRDIMSRGNTQTWSQILLAATQEGTINAEALKRYYQPLQQALLRFVRTNHIPIGW